jgi:hypothetical protein
MKDALPIERELHAERASALAATAERMERALAALAEVERALAEVAPDARAELEEKRRALATHAAERLWFYIVQREAMGLTQHEQALAYYRVPAHIRRRASPAPPRPRPFPDQTIELGPFSAQRSRAG